MMFFLHMNNVSELGVQFRRMVGRQVAHGSAVTVFLQSCESDSQWVVNFFMQVKPVALSSLRLAGLVFPPTSCRRRHRRRTHSSG